MAEKQGINLLAGGVSSLLGSMVIAGFLLGYATDYWLDTTPLFFLLFGLLGLIGGAQKVMKVLSHPEFNNVEKPKRRRQQ
ncbi:MAG: AtpZ/AtpI family protein [Gammaproteobacteria bacterium]|nr:AtpZ/AtpI family protein [Gammaproteobacteria bacterium]